MGIQTSLTDLYSQSSDTFDFRSSNEVGVKGGHDQNVQNVVNEAIWNTTWTDTTTEEASTTLDTVEAAIKGALTVRDISTDTPSVNQSDTFDVAADQIHRVLGSDIETSADVEELFGDTLNVRFVDDLTTTDGEVLNGAAILGTDEIVLNSALEGQALRETLTEEIAETAFQKAFDTTSKGDFGAEVISRIQGQEDEDFLAVFSERAETDTVQTDFGTAEADFPFTGFDNSVDVFNDVLELNFSGSEVDAVTEITEEQFDSSLVDVRAASKVTGQSENGQSLLGTQADAYRNVMYDAGAYDFDGDGDATDSFRAVIVNADTRDLSGLDDGGLGIEVNSTSNARFTPIEELTSEWLVGEADFSYQVRLTEGTSYSTTSEFNWSTAIAAEVGFEGGGFKAGGSVTNTVGGSISSTNEVTSSITTVETLTASADNYDTGTLVSVGAHAGLIDVNATDTYELYMAAYDESGAEAYFQVDISQTSDIEDYLLEIVQTDVIVDDLYLG